MAAIKEQQTVIYIPKKVKFQTLSINISSMKGNRVQLIVEMLAKMSFENLEPYF